MSIATGRYWRSVFFRAVSATVGFTKTKLLIGLCVALLGLLAKWMLIMDSADVALDLLIVAGSYLIVMIVYFVGSLIQTPALLDEERQEAIRKAGSTISDLRAELAKKHLVDAHWEEQVKKTLVDWSSEEKQFLEWLLNQGKTNVNDFHRSGLPQGVIQSAQNKGRRCGFIKNRTDGKLSLDFINPDYKEALRTYFIPK